MDGALTCYICIMNKLQNTFICLTREAYVYTLIAFWLCVYLSKFQAIPSINHDCKCFSIVLYTRYHSLQTI